MEILRRIAAWFSSRRRADDLTEEIEAHRAFAQDEFERAGLTPAEAAAESRRRMGNTLLAREDSREVWIVRWTERILQNVRYGARGLRREPAFAVTAILTLSLGIAAMTSVFSVVDAELWRPLPYPNPRRLVRVISQGPAPRLDTDSISIAEFLEWRQTMPALSQVAAEGNSRRRAVRHDDITEAMSVGEVTSNYFATLGRRPLIGRLFEDRDAHGSSAIVLGTRAWHRSFKSDPGILGRTLLIDNEPRTIVGIVTTDDTISYRESDILIPIDERPVIGSGARTSMYGAVGRMAAGASVEVVRAQAQAEFDRQAIVDTTRSGHRAVVQDLREYYTKTDRRSMYFFLGASIFVLVLTIVNVAALMLARGVRRSPEFALRGALGGGGRAIIGQLAVEAGLIAVPGAALGLWLTSEAMRSLDRVMPDDFLWHGTNVPVDYRVIAVCVVIVVLTMAGLALAPLGIARRAKASVVTAGSGRSTGMPLAARTRERLLIAQIAITVVLLTGGALFLRSFVALNHVPLGFDASDGWSMRLSLSGDRYRDTSLVRSYVSSLLDEAQAIPGVRQAAVATSSPLRSGWVVLASEPGSAADAAPKVPRSIYRAVSPTYFRTIGTPLTRGRGFLESDVDGAPRVAVINEEFARQFFGDVDPLGREVAIKGVHAPVPPGTVTIVGVAANIKEVGMNEVAFADLYVPFAQRPAVDVELLVRGNGASESMPDALRAAASRTDPAVPVAGLSTIDRRIAVALEQDRFNLVLAGGFAVVALLIAAIGIYGAMAYAAVARSREFGVRLALGATPRDLLQNALSHAARLGFVGAAIGVTLAIGCAFWLGDALYLVPGSHNGLLFNVKTTDPMSIATSSIGIVIVALAAGLIPSMRLAKTDPVKALRAD